MLDPDAFAKCHIDWVRALVNISDEVVAVDGKTLRRSHDRSNGKSAIHMVNAWAVSHGLVLGQVKTEAKSNEITAIPELLELLDLKGSVVTVDAMGCQKKIARQIVDQGADYAPPDWVTGADDIAQRFERLAAVERAIDEEVYRLYGISEDDRQAIELELAESAFSRTDDAGEMDTEKNTSEGDDEGDNANGLASFDKMQTQVQLSPQDLARQWISYAVGIVLGRFEPGMKNGLGRGRFSQNIVTSLLKLADTDAFLIMDEGHPDDLPAKVLQALKNMLGEEESHAVIRTATEKQGAPEDLLRQYLDRTFFKLHIQQYRKRPVYWFLQSPKKRYGIWVFHEILCHSIWAGIKFLSPCTVAAPRSTKE